MANTQLPDRTADTMSLAIGLSSPGGRMSKRSRDAAVKQLGEALFGGYVPAAQKQPTEIERLQKEILDWTDFIRRGYRVRLFTRQIAMNQARIAELS